METGGTASSPDNSVKRPSFRKPLNDAVNRKYRRHSPDGGGGSDSSPSHGSPKLERSHSPSVTKEVHSKLTDGQRGRDVERQLDRDVSRNRSGRANDSHRYTERQSYRNSYDFQRHGDHGKHHRRTDDDESYQRSYRLSRESKNGNHSENSRYDRVSDKSSDSRRTDSSRSENVDSRSRNYGRENLSKDYHKVDERSRQANSSRSSDKTGERDYHRDNEHYHDGKDHQKNPGIHGKNGRNEEMCGYGKGSTRGREGGTHHLKETGSANTKDYNGQDDQIQKRKRNEWEGRSKDKYPMEQEEEMHTEKKGLFDYQEGDGKKRVDKISNWSDGPDTSSTRLKFGTAADEKSSFSQQAEVREKVNAKTMSSTNNNSEAANTVDAAKVAALKAAELVNRNLVGAGEVGYLSTDQKKKLLWGSKKNNAAEESSNHWDLNLFSDKERQDKFNKLMSLRLPWCLWPLVGCEGGWCCCREQIRSEGWRPPGQETGRARDGLGEAIYGWPEAKRRPYSWSRLVMRPAFSSSEFKCMNKNVHKLRMLPFGCGRVSSFLLNYLKLLTVKSLDANEMILSFSMFPPLKLKVFYGV